MGDTAATAGDTGPVERMLRAVTRPYDERPGPEVTPPAPDDFGTGEGPAVTALGSTYVTKIDGSHVARACSLVEESFWAETTPLHTHVAAEEAFYVLEGGVAHGLRRLSSNPVRMLTLISPPGFERIVQEVAEQGEDVLTADPDRLVELAARFGTEILGDYPC